MLAKAGDLIETWDNLQWSTGQRLGMPHRVNLARERRGPRSLEASDGEADTGGVLVAWLGGGAPLIVSGAQPAGAQDDTLRVVMHSDLKIVDPIWTTAYISRNYGYMVYDTLFAMDEQLNVQPQMVDSYEISDDKLTYTFTLRDGLLWHDGAPVTAEDAIASIERWGEKDSMGQLLMSFVDGMKAVDDKTFQMPLKQPYGLVLLSLGKPSSNVPFIMPKRIAETPATEQI